MNDNSEVLTIKLLDRILQIKTSEANSAELQKAASLMDNKMQEIRKAKSACGNERIALMAGLSLAYDLINAKKQNEIYLKALNDKIKMLQDKLDTTLAPENKELF